MNGVKHDILCHTCLVLVVFMSKLLMNLKTWSLGSAGISAIVPGNNLGASSSIHGCRLICSTEYRLFGSSISIFRISDSQPVQDKSSKTVLLTQCLAVRIHCAMQWTYKYRQNREFTDVEKNKGTSITYKQ